MTENNIKNNLQKGLDKPVHQYFVVYQERAKFLGVFPDWRHVASEIIKASSLYFAREQAQNFVNVINLTNMEKSKKYYHMKDWRVLWIFQVNDDTKPGDVKPYADVEAEREHKENMAKITKGV